MNGSLAGNGSAATRRAGFRTKNLNRKNWDF